MPLLWDKGIIRTQILASIFEYISGEVTVGGLNGTSLGPPVTIQFTILKEVLGFSRKRIGELKEVVDKRAQEQLKRIDAAKKEAKKML
jgi:hypothetical protein